jgi:hypothetical protein
MLNDARDINGQVRLGSIWIDFQGQYDFEGHFEGRPHLNR